MVSTRKSDNVNRSFSVPITKKNEASNLTTGVDVKGLHGSKLRRSMESEIDLSVQEQEQP